MSSTDGPPPLTFTDEERKFLEKAAKKGRKVPTIAAAAQSLLDGKPIGSAVLAHAPSVVAQYNHGVPEHMAAVILCRLIPAGTPEADEAAATLAKAYGAMVDHMGNMGCLLILISLVAGFFTYAPLAGGDDTPIFRAYVETFRALDSPKGAGAVSRTLANYRRLDPGSLGEQSLAVLIPLLEQVPALKPGDLPASDLSQFTRLLNIDDLPNEVKRSAAKAIAAVGTTENLEPLKALETEKWSESVKAEVEQTVATLEQRGNG